MKKILSLLTATSFVTMMPELVAISSYEKEDKLSTSNFENEFFQDFQAVIENFESNNVEVSTLKTYTRVKTYSYLDDDNQKVPFVTDTTEAERDFVNLMNKFVKAYGLKTLNNIVKKISVVKGPKYDNYFMYSDLWPEWLFTLNKKLNVIRTQMCGMGCAYNHFVKTNNDILYSPAIAFDMFDFVNTVAIGVLAKDQNYFSTNNKTNLHIIAHEFAHAFETYFSFKKGYRNLLKDGISLSKFFLNKEMYYNILPSDYLITYLAKAKDKEDESWENKKELAYSIINSKYARYNYDDVKEPNVISWLVNFLFENLFSIVEYRYGSENNAELFAEVFAYWILATQEEKQTDNWKILNDFFSNEIKKKYDVEID